MSDELTIRELISAYRSDPDSNYCRSEDNSGLRYVTKGNYDSLMRRLMSTVLPAPINLVLADTAVADIDGRMMLRLHEHWSQSGVAMAHALVGNIRTLATYGAVLLKSADCRALKVLLHDMRFKVAAAREVHLTVEQIIAHRAQAHAAGLPSMALAQAIQFETAFRQMDVIGQFVPDEEPGVSEITWRGQKWLRGIRWSEIDDNLIMRHVTSKKQKKLEPDLKLAPMVLEELERTYRGLVLQDAIYDEHDGSIIREMVVDRSKLPTSGAIVISEETGRPWITHRFRRVWRDLARLVGIPDELQNRDTRATAITETTIHGRLEDAQQLAGHSDIATTQIYARSRAKRAANGQRARVVGRMREGAKKAPLKLLQLLGPEGNA